MCGIAGIFSNNYKNKLRLKKILENTKHRGPDHSGVWSDFHIAIGNNRLKVVDYDEKSNQPFKSSNGKFIVVFNGEIYNFKKLKNKFNLKTKTDSDTEVLIELFQKIGVKAFSLLEGMFAVAIYDTVNAKLYLARDIYGVKPLYYHLKKNEFSFCSEIKGIRLINRDYQQNNNNIVNFVKWGALDHSDETWFKDIFSLRPGSFLVLGKNKKIKIVKFYNFKQRIKIKNISDKEAIYTFKNLLEKSIEDQSKTIRSIGTNLSGGVDSSLMSLVLSRNKKEITSYTFGYEEKKYDERKYAKKISKNLNIQNFTSICKPKDVNKYFIDTLIMQDEPFTSFRQISHHKLYSDFKDTGSTVILEASGGDEIGAGYKGFLWPNFLDQVKVLGYKRAFNNLVSSLDLKINSLELENFINSSIENQKAYGTCTSDGSRIIDEDCIEKNFLFMYDKGKPLYDRPFENNLQNSQYIEFFHTKLPRGLRYIDRASSSSGREARVPLLSKDIVEFCFSLPNNLKIRQNELRWFMKKTSKLISKNFINLDNKRSIADPQRVWIKKDFKKMFYKLFKSKRFNERQIFQQDKVLKLFENFLKNKGSHSLGIFQIFITEIWFRLFIDNRPDYFKGAKLDEFIYETN